MKKYNPKTWGTLIFNRYSRDTFRKTVPNMLFVAIYTLLVTFVYETYLQYVWKANGTVHSLLGIVMGLFLVFRTNTAYDKWWEGRKIWGALVNDSRNLAIKMNAFLRPDLKTERKLFANYIHSYVVAMKDHLRDEKHLDDTSLDADEKGEASSWEHVPNYVASKLYKLVKGLYKNKELTGDELFIIDKEMKGLTDHIGACERIKNTPIPFSYSMYVKKFIFVYSITLPLGFVSLFHWFTIFVTLFIFYFLITIELIAEEIEEPFGFDDNDLPTDELAEKIGINVREILVDRPVV
jgi:putative membrane protein